LTSETHSTMKRRHFSASVLGLGATASWSAARAQSSVPVEGTHYIRLSQPQPVLEPGKIEVIEFFWYGCPHCNEFEPRLEAWVKRLPADVAFRRVPVAFRDEPFGTHQRIYYTLETMGLLDTMHKRVFAAIHVDHLRLDKPAEIGEFMQKNGVDGAKFMSIFNSFAIQTKMKQARTLADVYKIDGVPALGVNGQYFTSGTLAGSNDRALAVVDFLVARSRKK